MSQLQVSGEAKIRDIQGPVVANSGVITALDGAASQYVRGDGTLADFPTSTGGGSSVSYYLNSSVSQGTIGGVAYRELSKEPIIGAGTDITISANGYVASYITDANDPDVLSVPGGNFNCEFYFSVNNNTGNPTTYAELYKYDGTTFTLLGSSQAVPESLNQGTTIAPYYFAIPVATAALALTDRLAIRIYVSVDGRVVTLHTENSHLCQVVTTFSKGMVSLNNLTDQSQFITTGTSGTNFNIVSSGDTHTFNLPVASATNTGKLSSTDWSTFNNKLSTATAAATYVPYTGATTNVDLGFFNFDANQINGFKIIAKLDGTNSGSLILRTGTSGYSYGNDSISLISSPTSANTLTIVSDVSLVTKIAQIGLGSLTATRTYTLPDASGTIALTSNIPANIVTGTGTTNTLPKFTGTSTVGNSNITDTGSLITLSSNVTTTGSQFVQNGFYLTNANAGATAGYTHMWGADDGIFFGLRNATGGAKFVFQSATSYNYTFPAATGTLALTSDLGAYLPLTGGTLTGALSGTSATFTNTSTFRATGNAYTNGSIILQSSSGATSTYLTNSGGIFYLSNNGSTDHLQIASTGAATFSAATQDAIQTVIRMSGNNASGQLKALDFKLTAGTPLWTISTAAVGTDAGINIMPNGSAGLSLAYTGAATFSSSVTANGTVILGSNSSSTPYALGTSTARFQLMNGGVYGLAGDVLTNGNTYLQSQRTDGNTAAYNLLLQPLGGNVGIGTSSPTARLSIANSACIVDITSTTSTSFNGLEFKNGGGSFYLGQDNSGGGFYGGSAYAGSIYTSGAIPIILFTNATERMRITSGGNVEFNGTSSNSKIRFWSSYSGTPTCVGFEVYNASGTTMMAINGNGGSVYSASLGTGAVYSNGGTLTNTNPSDERLKDNITDISWGLNDILKLRPVSYHWKDDTINQGVQFGFIAQEVQNVMPEAIKEFGDDVKYLGLEKDAIYATLVKAIQELNERIKQLENK